MVEQESEDVLEAALDELRRATEDLRRLIRDEWGASPTNDGNFPDPGVPT